MIQAPIQLCRENKGRLLLALLLAPVALLGVYRGATLVGDDVLYARLAMDLASGKVTLGLSTLPCRLGFTLPLAALYAAFGVHDWTTVALPLISSLACALAAAFGANRLYGGAAAIWAVLLCGLSPIIYRYGSVGMADVPAGFLYGMFVLAWVLLREDLVRYRRVWALFAGLCCGWAVATRINIAPMILLTLVGFLTLDRRGPSLRRCPVSFFLLGAALISIPYALFFWHFTGNPLHFLATSQKGYYIEGVPWLRPFAGTRFWMRMSGLSILRAAVEGYLFALFPLIVLALVTDPFCRWTGSHAGSRYLLIAIISPLVILSHFSTTFTHWFPVHLDLRFGSPMIIPLAILVAGMFIHFPAFPLPLRARVGIVFAVGFAGALCFYGYRQQNVWTVVGAGASLITGLFLLGINRVPRILLPFVVLTVLAGSWLLYRFNEYPGLVQQNAALRRQAQAVPWDASHPVLTDPATAQYLPYVRGFRPELRLATWRSHGKFEQFSWTEQREEPWPGSYVIVWDPEQAETAAARWGGKVPRWVTEEVKKGTMISPLHDDSSLRAPEIDAPPRATDAYRLWPGAGIYLIDRAP